MTDNHWMQQGCMPLVELSRGTIMESLHLGAIAVVDAGGRLIAGCGNPDSVFFLRSSAKPLQAISFVEDGGMERFGFTDEELALICASHYGTDHHVSVAASMQHKVGASENDLLCGIHAPLDRNTRKAMAERAEKPTANRHQCSGKHSGMLANCALRDYPFEDYILPNHPLQRIILRVNAQMWDMPENEVQIGIDGCSVPVFAVPLRNAALGFARLADAKDLPPKRAAACQRIFSAMSAFPKMVAGDGIFDTEVMRVGKGRWISKVGSEGYQMLSIPAGCSSASERGIGVVLKILDGDRRGSITDLVALEVLRQLGVLQEADLEALPGFYTRTLHNWRGFEIGIIHPVFTLDFYDK